VVQGLSSGEGLLAALGAAPAAPKDGEPPPEAPGADGRLTVVETEFAKVLTAAKRDGNTLGPICGSCGRTTGPGSLPGRRRCRSTART
jgi:hypothetical protein